MATNGPLHPSTLFEHAQDAEFFHFPRQFAPEGANGHIYLPQPFATPVGGDDDHEDGVVAGHEGDGTGGHAAHGDSSHGEHGGAHHVQYEPVVELKTGMAPIDRSLLPIDMVLTKFMVIEVAVALIAIGLFGMLASAIKKGGAAKGSLANLLEVFLVFIRDDVARPAIGEKDADEYLPFLWTMFFFVLGCNLFGMIPWMGSPTGAFAVTVVLALLTFGVVLKVGISKYGFVGFLKAQVPHMDLPKPIAVVLVPMIFLIELFGLLVKHFVLSVRLLANMLAGHIVLAVLLGFIAASYTSIAWWGIAPASVLGSAAFSLLELFVAFLQAYVFVFLSALFIGAAVHPH